MSAGAAAAADRDGAVRPSRSRSPRCPACACRRGRAARSPTARWPRAGCSPTTAAWRRAVRQAVDKVVRRAFGLSVRGTAGGRAAQRRRGPGRRLRRPAGRGAGHAADHDRPRLPSTGSGAAALGVDASGSYRSAKPAARCIISVRRGGASRTVIATRSSTACRSSSPGAPTRLRTLDATARGSARAARPTRAACSPRTARRPTATRTPTYVEQPRRRWAAAPTTPSASSPTWSRAASARSRASRQALGAPSIAAAYPAAQDRGRRRTFRLVGLESVPDALARRGLGRQRRLRAAARAGRPSHAHRPQPVGRHHAHRAGLRGAALRALRRPQRRRRDPRAPSQRPRARRLGGPRRRSPRARPSTAWPARRRGSNPDVALSRRRRRGQGRRDRAPIRGRVRPGRNRDVPHAAVPALRRRVFDSGCRPRRSARSAGQPDPGREHQARDAEERVGRRRAPALPTSRASPRTSATTTARRPASRSTRARASAFRLDIYRMGWYQGNGRAQVATVSGAAVNQPTCATMPSQSDAYPGLVDCGTWSVTPRGRFRPTRSPASTSPSSIRNDNGDASHIFFVVRNDASHSDIYYQTSDTTWQAYNQYGGNSLYTGGPLHRPRPRRGGQLQPALHHARRRLGQDWVFNAEYPMIRWLERNGYDVSYETGVDTDRYGSLIENHRVFMSTGHDEYWSGQQRANVEAARDAGMNLAFFSGNEVFWKTRWENSTHGSPSAYRTMVTYKETHANAKVDPSRCWTGTWRDPARSPMAERAPRERAHGPDLHGQQRHLRASRSRRPTAASLLAHTRALRRWAAARPRRSPPARWATSGTPTISPGPSVRPPSRGPLGSPSCRRPPSRPRS